MNEQYDQEPEQRPIMPLFKPPEEKKGRTRLEKALLVIIFILALLLIVQNLSMLLALV